MKRNVGLAARCLCSGAFLLASLSIARRMLETGAIVHLKVGNDHSQCVTVLAVDAGVDGQPWGLVHASRIRVAPGTFRR